MYGDLTTSSRRLSWFRGRYRRIYFGIMAVWVPVFLCLTLATLFEFQAVANAEYNVAHSFVPVH